MVTFFKDYDSETDSLLMHKKDFKTNYSVEIGDNYVIDLDINNRVCGLELLHASKQLNLPKFVLEGIQKIVLKIKENLNGVLIIYQLIFKPSVIKKSVFEPVVTKELAIVNPILAHSGS